VLSELGFVWVHDIMSRLRKGIIQNASYVPAECPDISRLVVFQEIAEWCGLFVFYFLVISPLCLCIHAPVPVCLSFGREWGDGHFTTTTGFLQGLANGALR